MIESLLLDILACPVCKIRLGPDAAGTTLTCLDAECGRTYRVVDGIPLLLVSDELEETSLAG
ncbi:MULTISPECIES: Trm112 family protein [Streptomyces]|uniref:Trm112 family protein n=1 Tax=Streptomyces TaxID=1883 RepID=UPI0004C5170F|nr:MULTISPECIES: Trm112 family protein [Streptomyces]MDX2917322.1 Trm112 family protein [Streptomyces sp. NE06-03C]MDX3605481.1 Trm112 family protein [Streptomyces sp. FL06-04B]MDX3736417.1 Trm112 family protein [Streptomyces sp. ID01-15D]